MDRQYGANERMIPDFARLGDQNLHREQGHIQIESNTISHVSEYGIRYDAAARDAVGSVPHPGSVLNVSTLNNKQLAPGATIANNVVANFGVGGILVSGDPNPVNTPLASTPFARIVNSNTVYGAAAATGIGIQVTENASPTILNNIVANTQTGISADASSSSTVVATYSGARSATA